MGQNNTKWHRHYGIYGVCLNERGNLLVIEKMVVLTLASGIYRAVHRKIPRAFPNVSSVKCLKKPA